MTRALIKLRLPRLKRIIVQHHILKMRVISGPCCEKDVENGGKDRVPLGLDVEGVVVRGDADVDIEGGSFKKVC